MLSNTIEIFFQSRENIKDEVWHNQNSRRFKRYFQPLEYFKKHFEWCIHRYDGVRKDDWGHMQLPSNKLGKGITNELVLEQVNNKNCFDFDYTPIEGDNLKLFWSSPGQSLIKTLNHLGKDGGVISFIYRDGKWKDDYYLTDVNRYEIASGRVLLSSWASEFPGL